MAINSNQLNEDGYAKCIVCGKKFFINDLESCSYCDRFVCKSCCNKKNGYIVCKKCGSKK
jgi:hypothetical protein